VRSLQKYLSIEEANLSIKDILYLREYLADKSGFCTAHQVKIFPAILGDR
jgi:hypothetical protein